MKTLQAVVRSWKALLCLLALGPTPLAAAGAGQTASEATTPETGTPRAGTSQADGKDSGAWDESPFAQARRYWVESQALGEARAIDVALPASYEVSAHSRQYPVILVLDGEFQFQTVAAVVGHLASVGRMPESLVVGLPNPPGRRFGLIPPFLGQDGKARESQADLYVDFLQAELFPFLEARWRLAPFRTVVGLSPTASFTLHAFARAPELFQAHIAMVIGKTLGRRYSPEQTVAMALEQSMKSRPERRAFLFLGLASSNYDEGPEMAEQLDGLTETLAPYRAKNLVFQAEVVTGSAYAIALEALVSAFEMIYPRKLWDLDYLASMTSEGSAPEVLSAHFAGLSERYGFQIYPLGNRFFNVHCLRGLGSRLSSQERFEEAVAIFERWTLQAPSDPQASFYLAGALDKSGDLPRAVSTARRGLELARQARDHDLSFYESAVRRLEDRLEGDSTAD